MLCAMQPSASPGSSLSNSGFVPRAPLAALGRLGEPVVADLVALGPLPAGVLAGEEQLAALVHVVTRVDLLVEVEARGAGAAGLARPPGDVVVARVPDDRLVVAEHAQPVGRRRVVRVDVVDVVADVRLVERAGVVREVLRPARVLVRRRAGVVLVGHDQHRVAALLHGPVVERRRVGGAVLAGEPDADAVTRLGAGDDAADAVVVDARVLAVALAALPLGGRHGPHRAVVDAELQRDGAERRA